MLPYDDEPEDAKPTALAIAMAEAARRAREKEAQQKEQNTMAAETTDTSGKTVKQRVFDFLKARGTFPEYAMPGTLIAKDLRLPPQSVFTALYGLHDVGVLDRDKNGGTFHYRWNGKELTRRPYNKKSAKSQVVTPPPAAPSAAQELQIVVLGHTMTLEAARRLYEQLRAIFDRGMY